YRMHGKSAAVRLTFALLPAPLTPRPQGAGGSVDAATNRRRSTYLLRPNRSPRPLRAGGGGGGVSPRTSHASPRPWLFAQVQAGVDEQRFAGDVAGCVRQEEERGGGDVVRLGGDSKRRRLRDVVADALRHFFAESAGEPARIDEAGADRVHADFR